MILGDDNNDDDADDEEDIDDDFDEKNAIDKDRYCVQREEPLPGTFGQTEYLWHNYYAEALPL